MTSWSLVLAWAAIVASLAATCAALLRVPALRERFERLEDGRRGALDGLRGVLAISVFAHHADLTRAAAIAGSWTTPATAFVQVLGLGAVAIFFMITAYLFWSRTIALGGDLAAGRFYRARLRRIYPAFAGSIVALLAVVAWQTGFALRESPAVLVREVAGQFSLGIAAGATVNGLPHANLIDAGVTWSLAFECGFYALLPLLGRAVRARRSWIAFAVVALVALAFARHLWIVGCFLPGMLAAELERRPRAAAWFARFGGGVALASFALLLVATVAAPAALFTLAHGPQADVVPQLVALCGIFAGVTLGGPLPLLERRELRFAGAISYSVYLLHAIVLYVAARSVESWMPVARMSQASYAAFVLACVPVVALVATASFVALEEPFLHVRRRSRGDVDALRTSRTVEAAVSESTF